MITSKMFEHLDAKQHANGFAYTAMSLAYVARLALENDTTGAGMSPAVTAGAVSETLEVIEALLAVVIDGTDSRHAAA